MRVVQTRRIGAKRHAAGDRTTGDLERGSRSLCANAHPAGVGDAHSDRTASRIEVEAVLVSTLRALRGDPFAAAGPAENDARMQRAIIGGGLVNQMLTTGSTRQAPNDGRYTVINRCYLAIRSDGDAAEDQ